MRGGGRVKGREVRRRVSLVCAPVPFRSWLPVDGGDPGVPVRVLRLCLIFWSASWSWASEAVVVAHHGAFRVIGWGVLAEFLGDHGLDGRPVVALGAEFLFALEDGKTALGLSNGCTK